MWQSFADVETLKAGRNAAPETEPVGAAPDVGAVLAGVHFHPEPARRAVLAAMIRAQRMTEMRPGEVCGLRPEHLAQTADVWVYEVRPETNRNALRDKRRAHVGPGCKRSSSRASRTPGRAIAFSAVRRSG